MASNAGPPGVMERAAMLPRLRSAQRKVRAIVSDMDQVSGMKVAAFADHLCCRGGPSSYAEVRQSHVMPDTRGVWLTWHPIIMPEQNWRRFQISKICRQVASPAASPVVRHSAAAALRKVVALGPATVCSSSYWKAHLVQEGYSGWQMRLRSFHQYFSGAISF